jgi:endonuclease/exonuclease/phosphatase family metal-dependent hydrolase
MISAPSAIQSPGRVKRWLGTAYVLVSASLLGCTLIGRLASAVPGWLVVLVMVLPLAFGSLTALGLLLWAWGAPGARRTVGALVLAGAWLWLSLFLPWRGGTDGDSVRILNWNVQRFWGVDNDRDASRSCVQETLARIQPDVLSLVEISKQDVIWLEKRLGLKCAHTNALIKGPSDADDTARSGLAVCVPIDGLKLTRSWPHRLTADAPQHAQFAEIEGVQGRFNVMAIYLPTYEEVRDAVVQLRAGESGALGVLAGVSEVSRTQIALAEGLIQHVEARFADPTILAGDFNITRDFATHRRLRRTLADTWERVGFGFGGTRAFGGFEPRVDFIYADRRFRILGAEIFEAPCSDHKPTLAEVALEKQKG